VIEEFCDWLSKTRLSVAFQSADWFVPTVQTVHIIAVGILLISIYVVSFHMIGLVRVRRPLATICARSTPWIWTALAVLMVTGSLLTVTEPARELLNWVFRTKMLLVLTLASLIALVQWRMRANPAYWTESPARRRAARALGSLCIVIGAGAVTAGRWIAYV
jgi:hypothetical protein